MTYKDIRHVVIVFIAAGCARTAAAQSPRIEWQIPSVIALDAGTLPDAFTSRCGRGLIGMPGWGTYVAVAARRGTISLQGDTRAVVSAQSGGCTADLPVVQLGENLFETRPGWRFFEGTPRAPLVVSSLRGAVHFGPAFLRTGVKGGGGVVWGSRETPVVVGSMSTLLGRGPRAFYLEFELMQAWVNATQQVERYTFDSLGYVSLGVRTVSTMLKPRWLTLRAGIAFR